MMTEQEYQDKMSRYRKKRRFHQDAIHNIDVKMDRLESDRQQVELKVGKYVKYRRRDGILTEYLMVDKFKKSRRGYELIGNGFTYYNDMLRKIDKIMGSWDNVSWIQTISEDEYHEALEKAINDVRLKCEPKEKVKTNVIH